MPLGHTHLHLFPFFYFPLYLRIFLIWLRGPSALQNTPLTHIHSQLLWLSDYKFEATIETDTFKLEIRYLFNWHLSEITFYTLLKSQVRKDIQSTRQEETTKVFGVRVEMSPPTHYQPNYAYIQTLDYFWITTNHGFFFCRRVLKCSIITIQKYECSKLKHVKQIFYIGIWFPKKVAVRGCSLQVYVLIYESPKSQ